MGIARLYRRHPDTGEMYLYVGNPNKRNYDITDLDLSKPLNPKQLTPEEQKTFWANCKVHIKRGKLEGRGKHTSNKISTELGDFFLPEREMGEDHEWNSEANRDKIDKWCKMINEGLGIPKDLELDPNELVRKEDAYAEKNNALPSNDPEKIMPIPGMDKNDFDRLSHYMGIEHKDDIQEGEPEIEINNEEYEQIVNKSLNMTRDDIEKEKKKINAELDKEADIIKESEEIHTLPDGRVDYSKIKDPFYDKKFGKKGKSLARAEWIEKNSTKVKDFMHQSKVLNENKELRI